MSNTQNSFRFAMYLGACAASVMLAFAEGGWLLPAMLTVPIAAAAWRFVEQRGGGLSTLAANSLGIVAVGVALLELAIRDIEGRLLFGAHLLVYLSWIVLWQPKRSQQRWGLIALSVLQVALGGVLTTSGLYGLAMAGFMVLMVWTLILLQLADAEAKQSIATSLPAGATTPTPAVLIAPGNVAPVAQAAIGRWPFWQIAAATAVTLTGAAAVGGTFFMLIPRFEFTRYAFEDSDEPLARQRRTGFTERVRLGEFGEILESNVPVFDVRLYEADGEPLDVIQYAERLGLDEPLFRGAVLTEYSDGEWRTPDRRFSEILRRSEAAGAVRQEYRIRASGSDALFAIAPVHAGKVDGTDEPIRWRPETRTIRRPRGRRYEGELSYTIYSMPQRPALSRLRTAVLNRYFGSDPIDATSLPNDLVRLREIATRVARPVGQPASEVDRATRLLEYLRDSGEFQYTLTGELIDPSIDPVEDFLVNRKQGHCEYFASALALMLRAEQIPSRVVTGFKGGEPNRLSRAFEVQQRHAHAWVEAYLDGAWVTLDPSPSSGRDRTVQENAPSVPLWNDLRSTAAILWREYIVELNLGRQRQALAPVRELAVSAIDAIRNDLWPSLRRQAYALATDPSRWFSWQGGVATFFGLLMTVTLWRLGRRLILKLAGLRDRRAAKRRQGRRVEFYERFRRLCERRGWKPPPSRTAREFAAEVAAAPIISALPEHLAELPGELTEDFYRIRFGHEDLPERRMLELDARLSEMESALSNGGPDASTAREFQGVGRPR